jgi:hypothetical protein
MKKHRNAQQKTIRRSVALPGKLVAEVMRLAPAEASKNWNRLVITALEEYAARRKRLQFEETMAAMAADPAIQSETKAIDVGFRRTERDGLSA